MTVELGNTKQYFGFFKWTMPESRKADFYLGCLDDSVFLDFNYSTNKCINLCRISFQYQIDTKSDEYINQIFIIQKTVW